MKHLEITTVMRDAIAAVDRAERIYVPGRDSASIVEIPKLALANAVLLAVRAQTVTKLSTVPRPRPATVVPIIDLELRRKRRVR